MIDEARRLLADASTIVSFSGAGLSAESGISTFRDTETGLWATLDPRLLASPEGFAADPTRVLEWYGVRRRAIAEARPNPAHLALAARTDIRHVTQNIDDLLERAGASGVIHLHGLIGTDRCHAGCGHQESIDLAAPPPLRDCPRCGGRMRPGVVWFGEMLPMDAWIDAETACGTCNALLVVGTSAAVQPAAGLIGLAKSAGASIIIVNTDPSEASYLADLELLGPAGEILPTLLAE
jgi:NAD-dependent deacetylase